MKFSCEKDTRFRIINKSDLEVYLASLPKGNYILSVERVNKKRSLNENRYYHGVVVVSVRNGFVDMGWDMTLEETHEFLKARFNTKEFVTDAGEILSSPRSTTELTTVEFEDYLEKCKRFASEYLGVVIPDPNEQGTLF